MPWPELDADLLEGCRRGEPDAQRALFERYRHGVYSVSLHFLEGDEAAAQDVTQRVFVKVFGGLAGFRQEARFTTWLYRIASNACTDELRRRRRLHFFGELPPRLHPRSPAHHTEEGSPEIARAVRELSPKLRITVLLRYFEDLSYDEIGDALGISPGTVASRLGRAHAILARKLAHIRRNGDEGR